MNGMKNISEKLKRNKTLQAVLILTLAFAAYSNTLNVPFQMDDAGNIINNALIKDYRNFINPFAIGSGTMEYGFKSRFAGYFTFALNYWISGADVFSYHVFNIAVHMVNSLLVLILVKLLLNTPLFSDNCKDIAAYKYLPFLTAMVFALHPVQTQAVTYIVQRLTSLCSLFYLAAVVLYITARVSTSKKRFFYYALSAISAVLAMKTKETAFTLPFMLTLIEFSFFTDNFKRKLKNLFPFYLTLIIIPLTLYGGSAKTGGALAESLSVVSYDEISRGDYLRTQFPVIVRYLKLLCLPIGQNLDYDFPVFKSFFNLRVLLSFLLLLGIFLFALYLYKISKSHPIAKLAGFGILWFFLALSVESSVIPIADVIFEHRLYLPSVGLFLTVLMGVSYLTAKLERKNSGLKKYLIILTAVITLILLVLTYKRNSVWGNSVTLWQDTALKSPGKARPHNNFGNALFANGQIDAALKEYIEAVRLKPVYYEARYNLGKAYEKLKRTDLAEKQYVESIRLKPDFAEAFNNLAGIYEKRGDKPLAFSYYSKAVALKPDFPEAINNIGQMYESAGKFDAAMQRYQKALRVDPSYEATYNNLGNLYFKLRRFPEAISHYQRAIVLNPDFAEAHNNLGNCYDETGDLTEAITQYTLAVRLKPDFAEAHNNLGTAYARVGRVSEARQQYDEALKLKPNYGEAAYNLGLLKR
ncbi:MAG: tetratricopeptide repeat protein [Nitrospirae bacterium]|nr:tetratricopeptide repeat protein [Nitrospirota bacterium]MBF0533813.1 tetratricopeptide repeat protein [Nitrospirota bacterium]MBF0615478.1 tetratricopeptide repeat protein [Nitrospirota bacterium]